MRIKEVLAVTIDTPIEEISDEASMDDLENWDSLAQMNLVIALEEEFQIEIPDDEGGTMVSISLIASLISEIMG